MPTYDYACDANERIIEVRHKMSETIASWGELCEIAEIDAGSTPIDVPVRKLVNGGQIVTSGHLGEPNMPPCSTGNACPSGGCG